MTTHSPAAGWYTDPNGGSGLRYWDGAGWTDATQPAPQAGGYPAAQPSSGYPAAQPSGGYPAASPASNYPAAGAGSYPGTAPGYPTAGQGAPYPGPGLPPGANPAPRAFAASNKFALITVAICVVYALIASFSNFAVFGILPALYTFRSFQAKEKFALVALVVTLGTIVYSLNAIYGG